MKNSFLRKPTCRLLCLHLPYFLPDSLVSRKTVLCFHIHSKFPFPNYFSSEASSHLYWFFLSPPHKNWFRFIVPGAFTLCPMCKEKNKWLRSPTSYKGRVHIAFPLISEIQTCSSEPVALGLVGYSKKTLQNKIHLTFFSGRFKTRCCLYFSLIFWNAADAD